MNTVEKYVLSTVREKCAAIIGILHKPDASDDDMKRALWLSEASSSLLVEIVAIRSKGL